MYLLDLASILLWRLQLTFMSSLCEKIHQTYDALPFSDSLLVHRTLLLTIFVFEPLLPLLVFLAVYPILCNSVQEKHAVLCVSLKSGQFSEC